MELGQVGESLGFEQVVSSLNDKKRQLKLKKSLDEPGLLSNLIKIKIFPKVSNCIKQFIFSLHHFTDDILSG